MLIYPNAKINIGLNIVERRPDGYHNLETVFYPIPLQDALEIHDSKDGEYHLKVSGEILDGSPADNLVTRAYRLLHEHFPEKVVPVDIHLFKHIPTGAGLGGGSADAAFTLVSLNERFNLRLTPQQLEQFASKLGADCPVFVRNQPVFARGIGNEFTPVQIDLSGKTIVLVKPNIFISTKDAYGRITPHQPKKSLIELIQQPVETWAESVVNNFEESIFPLYPEIAAIKDRLYDLGAVYASMSGSGASVYGIFNQPLPYVDEIFAGYFCRQRTL